MKTMKKIISLLVVAVMVLAMTVNVFATDKGKADIEIQHGTIHSTYSAYKLFDVTHDGGDNYSYTVNTKYLEIIKAALKTVETSASVETPKQCLELINGFQSNSTKMQQFADELTKKISGSESGITADFSVDAEVDNATVTIQNVDPGYYLVTETTEDSTQTISSSMINTASSEDPSKVTVHLKKDTPTLVKQIKHNETGEWGKVGDNFVGSIVEYRLITKVPNYMHNYETYNYIIHDKMDAGLTSNVKSAGDLKIKVGDNDNKVIPERYVTIDTVPEDGCTFHATIDVKQAVADKIVNEGEKLYTYYTATLNENAIMYDKGSNNNEAYLEYSNNPYDDTKSATTPKEIVRDWAFKMTLKKIKGANKAEVLPGAKFVFSKKSDLGELKLDENGNVVKADGSQIEENALAVFVKEEDGSYRVATAAEVKDSDVTKHMIIEAGDVVLEGFDDRTDYFIYEVQAPKGYNKLTNPVKVIVNATYDNGDAAKPTVVVTVDGVQGQTQVQIENFAGSILPSTGGVGTTLFYVIGGIMVAGAAVLLVTKRLVNAKQ